MDTILILDFGSQYSQLIARRIRAVGVFTEIIPGDTQFQPNELKKNYPNLVGIVLSGSPHSVYESGAPQPSPEIFKQDLPILGICYGVQVIMQQNGGKVERLPEREYGSKTVAINNPHPLFKGLNEHFESWMSHGDSIKEAAPGFEILARSHGDIIAAVSNPTKKIYGLQFHPEVSHCEGGQEIIRNFVLDICAAKAEWTMQHFIETARSDIHSRVKENPVLLLISGGVDSTVVGALLLKILPAQQVHLLYIDTGLMRKNENSEVLNILRSLGAQHIHTVNAETEFLQALAGQSDPEGKRKIIGDLFMTIQEREVTQLKITDAILVQGTLYTDLIESGKGIGKKAQVIKSHHNVRSPLVEAKRAAGKIIEPLDKLYKDEVRSLGSLLGLSDTIVWRHPFPGPGLAVRILGEITKEGCDLLREVDAVYIDELRKRGLYREIWQAFAVLLPIKSVGVAGDERSYKAVVALRAVQSLDGMTAQIYPFKAEDLIGISTAITNKVPNIGRVTYDISSKPPSTIEWE